MRGLSLLLGACGAIFAGLLWRQVAGMIAPPADGASVAGRLGLALAWLMPALGVLWLMVGAQMGVRFVAGVFDPLAGREGRFLAVNQRVITNTAEQLAIFVPALLALAAWTDHAHMPGVMALAVVFAVSRLLFWAGYLVAPIGRGFGMAATASVTTAALIAAAVAWFSA